MATLEKIRNRGVFLVIIIGLALLAFVLGDFFRGGSTIMQDNRMVVLNVNGEKIKVQDYERRVEDVKQNYKVMGREDIDEASQQQIRNQVFTSLIMENVLKTQAEKIGLSVPPAEVFDLVQGTNVSPIIQQSPLFINPQTGRFDPDMVLNIRKAISEKQLNATPEPQRSRLMEYRNMWLAMEHDVKNLRLSEKYGALLSKAIVANKLDAEEFAAYDAEIADIAYVAIPASTLADSLVNIEEKEYKAFYDGHKEFFRQPAYREMDIVYTHIRPSEEDIADCKAEVEEVAKELRESEQYQEIVSAYSDRNYIDAYLPLSALQSEYFYTGLADEISAAEVGTVLELHQTPERIAVAKLIDSKIAPDSLLLRHILFQPTAEGKATADSLMAILKKNPEPFDQFVAEYSIDNNSKANNGEIGWLTEFTAAQYLGSELRDAIFNASVKHPFTYDSPYGRHILLVEKATVPIKKYKVAYVDKKITAGTETYTEAYNAFSAFKAQHTDPAKIDTAALNAGYQVLNNMGVYPSSSVIASNIERSRELVRWAFNSKKDEISEIKEFGDKYVFAILRKSSPQGFKALADAKEEMRPLLLTKKKTEKLYNELKGKGIASPEAYAAEHSLAADTVKYVGFNTQRVEGIGFETAMNAAAAFAPLQKTELLKGEQGVYILNVLSREKNPNPSITPENAKDLMQSNMRGKVRVQALQSLMSRSEIEDNRTNFY